jgi:hypothetical protein
MPNYETPAHFKPGVLDRKTEFGKLKGVPIVRDVLPVIPFSDWNDYLSVSERPKLRELIWNIYDQDGVGSCASEAMDKGIEVVRAMAGRPPILLNPFGTYHFVSGGRDNGSSLDDNVTFARDHGAFPESVWPRSKGWKTAPNDAAMEAALDYRLDEVADIDDTSSEQFMLEIGSTILLPQDFGVYCGIPGHGIYVTDLVSVERTLAKCIVEFCNSWDISWGDFGFGQTTLGNIVRSYGAFVPRTAVQAACDLPYYTD